MGENQHPKPKPLDPKPADIRSEPDPLPSLVRTPPAPLGRSSALPENHQNPPSIPPKSIFQLQTHSYLLLICRLMGLFPPIIWLWLGWCLPSGGQPAATVGRAVCRRLPTSSHPALRSPAARWRWCNRHRRAAVAIQEDMLVCERAFQADGSAAATTAGKGSTAAGMGETNSSQPPTAPTKPRSRASNPCAGGS